MNETQKKVTKEPKIIKYISVSKKSLENQGISLSVKRYSNFITVCKHYENKENTLIP
jgi:Primosomal protein DnaI N-terminus.